MNTKNMLLCFNKFINLCQHANMYENVIVETLSGTFNAILFRGGGGNVDNVVLHVNATTLRGLISFMPNSHIDWQVCDIQLICVFDVYLDVPFHS